MTKWKVIEDSSFYTTWQCPQCSETYTGKKKLGPLDIVPDSVKEARVQYAKDIVQPYRQGEFSREYKEAYPERSKDMVREGVITKKQYDNAKDVWKKDIKGL